jgi:hypothetical protein
VDLAVDLLELRGHGHGARHGEGGGRRGGGGRSSWGGRDSVQGIPRPDGGLITLSLCVLSVAVPVALSSAGEESDNSGEDGDRVVNIAVH